MSLFYGFLSHTIRKTESFRKSITQIMKFGVNNHVSVSNLSRMDRIILIKITTILCISLVLVIGGIFKLVEEILALKLPCILSLALILPIRLLQDLSLV